MGVPRKWGKVEVRTAHVFWEFPWGLVLLPVHYFPNISRWGQLSSPEHIQAP